MNIIENYNWRYATKRMNGENIDSDKTAAILEAVRLAPSSMGLQPFRVIVAESKEIREQLKSACNNQPQITESAFMLIFAVITDNYKQVVEDYIKLIAKTRNQSEDSLSDLKNRLQNFTEGKDKIVWAARQAYIALGFGLATAAMLKVDSTPMEGFNPEAVDKVLGLGNKGLKSVVMMAVGNRDEKNDYLVNLPKVRKAAADFFIHI